MKFRPTFWIATLIPTIIPAFLHAQTDPGPRPGQPTAGAPLPGLTAAENSGFQEGARRFAELVSVLGTQPGAPDKGLGPRFNLNSCAGCHAQPAIGGSSPALNSPQAPRPNPQVALATAFGATNTVPSFITVNGPVRVARFVKNPDGSADGGVHALFTIRGRADAAGCNITQPDFATAVATGNAIFRIPTPVFGAGLIEAIQDATILANKTANTASKAALGITGHENRNGNDGTITRFGWKAQNKSLEIFAGEAYNVEEGVTNELFPTERDETPGCATNPTPEDTTNYVATTILASLSDTTAFGSFMRFLAPPAPAQTAPQGPPGAPPRNAQPLPGQNTFTQIGCALCHTPTMTTGLASSAALSQKQVVLYSDLLVHHMGTGLADGITQGNAQGDEFRSAPLWGLGQRIFFLHDGRTTDLKQAIEAHSGSGSEANSVVGAFNSLPAQAQQDLLNFLRSL